MTEYSSPDEARLEAHLRVGRHWMEAGIPLRAIASLRSALAESPSNAMTHALLASALASHAARGYGVTPGERNSLLEEALAHANNAVGLEPGEAIGYMARADVYWKRELWLAARVDFEAALRIKPDDAGLHLSRAGALFQLQRPDEAEMAARHACALDPLNADALMVCSKILAFNGRRDEARETAETAMRLRPNDSSAHELLGEMFLKAGHFPEARRSMLEALQIDPTNPTARGSLFSIDAASIWWQKPYWMYMLARRNWPRRLQRGVDISMAAIVATPLLIGWVLLHRPANWDLLTRISPVIWYSAAALWSVCLYWELVHVAHHSKLEQLRNPAEVKSKDPLAVQLAAVIFALLALWLAWYLWK